MTRDVGEGELNKRLYAHWEDVFQQIDSFHGCVCLRRVRCAVDLGTDVDFLLLKGGSDPKLGIVECEGHDSDPPEGVQQLLRYVAGFKTTGATILEESIKDAFDTRKRRGRMNEKRWAGSGRSGLVNWQGRAGARTERELARVLDAASKRVVPILIYYRDKPLKPLQKSALSLAFRGHPLYVGIVSYPAANKLIAARYFAK